MNSKSKGKRGELEWAHWLANEGYKSRRGQQFSGSPDSPDVICDDLPWLHFEVKRNEKLNIMDAMIQATADAGSKTPVVAHRKNNSRWLITMAAEDWIKIIREVNFTPDR